MQKQHTDNLSTNLQNNLVKLKEAFSYPVNQSLKVREFHIPYLQKQGALLYIEGAADTKLIENHILRPILQYSLPEQEKNDQTYVEPTDSLLHHVLTASESTKLSKFSEAIEALLSGDTLIIIDQDPIALSIRTRGFKSRSVTEPTVESIIRGPKEGFIESLPTNQSLIRKLLLDQNLISEMLTIGERSKKNLAILYIKDLANPELVINVKRRVSEIRLDNILQLSMLESHLEENSYSLFPSVLLTERPDRACSFLLEGHVILLMDGSPQAMIVPITFWALFQTGEENYMRWPYGNFLRIIRLLALFIAVLTPAFFISVSTFHPEMLPTDLMLAIAATRERVPFSSFVEIIFMEVTFEILREAGVRIPNLIGPTVGIVGALILGQAAVDANIVSPILVIIVALTGLASFTIADNSLNFAVRISRFLLLFAAFTFGFYGIALLFTFILAYMVALTSFGVPFLAPMAPHLRSSKDMILLPPNWKQRIRPMNIKPQSRKKQPKPEGN